jgi:hypothetical protein
VEIDHVHRLGVDDRLDDAGEALLDDRRHACPLPALGQLEKHLRASGQPKLARAEVQVDELGEEGPEERSPAEQPASDRADHGKLTSRLGDDGLVEIQEDRLPADRPSPVRRLGDRVT